MQILTTHLVVFLIAGFSISVDAANFGFVKNINLFLEYIYQLFLQSEVTNIE